jgi:hypothetical protein
MKSTERLDEDCENPALITAFSICHPEQVVASEANDNAVEGSLAPLRYTEPLKEFL